MRWFVSFSKPHSLQRGLPGQFIFLSYLATWILPFNITHINTLVFRGGGGVGDFQSSWSIMSLTPPKTISLYRDFVVNFPDWFSFHTIIFLSVVSWTVPSKSCNLSQSGSSSWPKDLLRFNFPLPFRQHLFYSLVRATVDTVNVRELDFQRRLP